MLNHSSHSGLVGLDADDWVAVEGERVSGAQESAPEATRHEPDPSWQPL